MTPQEVIVTSAMPDLYWAFPMEGSWVKYTIMNRVVVDVVRTPLFPIASSLATTDHDVTESVGAV